MLNAAGVEAGFDARSGIPKMMPMDLKVEILSPGMLKGRTEAENPSGYQIRW